MAGLCNMFLPKRHYPNPLTNLESAPVCEIMVPLLDPVTTATLPERSNGLIIMMLVGPIEDQRCTPARSASAP